MKKHYLIYLLISSVVSLIGCKSSYHTLEKQHIARAEARLGMQIRKSDPLPLFLEAAGWVGTPYRAGGITKKGTDCSGLTYSIYREVYQKQLARSSADMYEQNCVRIRRKSNLKSGDLVFFRTAGTRRITHVGIYLKDNCFIHASTTKGVQINRLDEPYYRKTFYRSGRVK